MSVEAVPAGLLTAGEALKQRRGVSVPWPAWAILAASVCAAVLVIPRAENTPRITHVKGDASLVVSITRDEALVEDETPVEKLAGVRVGDRLRIRVVNAQEQQVQLEMCSSDGQCDTLFSGVLPQDAWVPAGMRIATPTPTILRLRVCPVGQPLQQCPPQDFALRGL